MKHSGQSMAEYGIIACLVAVVAVPALVLLSDNTNDLLGNMFQGNPPTVTNGAGAVRNNGSNSGGNVNGGGGGSVNQFIVRTGRPVYDPTTGQFTFPVLESNGGGTSTASVSGSDALAEMSKQLRAVADAYRAKGEPLPSDLSTRLSRLAEIAGNLGDLQSDKKPKGDEMLAQGQAYAAIYSELGSLYSQQYPEVFNLTTAYSGIISRATQDTVDEILARTNNDKWAYDDDKKTGASKKGSNDGSINSREYKLFAQLGDTVASMAELSQEERADATYDQQDNLNDLSKQP